MAFNGGLGTAPALNSDSGAIVWRHPSLDIEVYIQPSPAASLPDQALQALRATPPVEIGGLLLGQLSLNGRLRTFMVTGAELVTGNGSAATERFDVAGLFAAARNYPARVDLRPIGFFRSNLRQAFSLTEEDLDVMRGCFAPGECVALLLTPQPDGACVARFFLAESANFPVEKVKRDEPFGVTRVERYEVKPARMGEAQLAAESPGLRDAGRLQTAVPAPSSPVLVREEPVAVGAVRDSELRVPQPRPAPPSTSSTSLRVMAVALSGALAALGLYVYTHSQSSWQSSQASHAQPTSLPSNPAGDASRSEPGLGLAVARPEPGELDVKWDRNLVQGGTGGEFHITDGVTHRTLVLDRLQLNEGKLSYFPRSADVHFTLDVFLPDDRTISESLRVVGSEVTVTRNNTAVRAANIPAGPSNTAPSIPAPISLSTASTSETPAVVAKKDAATPPTIETVPSTVGTPPEILSANVPAAAPMEVPKAAANEISTPVPGNGTAAPQHPATLAPASEVADHPLNQPKPELSPTRYLDPKPVRQVMPEVRSILTSDITQPTRVEIVVQLDSNGKVTAAHLRGKANLLTGACIIAARQWKFTPARLNDKQVESTFVINFDFKPRRPQ